MLDLPYDVWLLICSYLPDDQIRDLYVVNRTLFEIAMNLRYREISLDNILPKVVGKGTDIRKCRVQPSLVSRPRKVHIDLTPSLLLAYEHYGSVSCSRRAWNVVSGRSVDKLVQQLLGTYIEDVLDILRHLTSVTTLYVQSFFGEHNKLDPLLRKLYHGACNILRNRITKVVVAAPLQDLDLVVPPVGSIHLTRLVEVGIHILKQDTAASVTESNDTAHGAISSFLIAHRTTLRTITLKTVNSTISLLPCLGVIADIPTIYNLDVNSLFLESEGELDGLYEVLTAHCNTLKSLSLQFTNFSHSTTAHLFSQKWCQVQLPNLTTLVLEPRWETLLNVGRFVQQFATTLTSLTLKFGIYYTYSEHWDFTRVLQQLRHFDFFVPVLDPTILADVARNLPLLQSLYIKYYCICPREAKKFSLEMKEYKEVFSGWGLWSLEILRHGPSWRREFETEAVIVKHFPNVRLFNGLERQKDNFGEMND